MGLSTDLISQFAKVTNDQKASRIDEAILYGEVVEFEDKICVRFDGSSELTPVTTIAEKDEDGNIVNYKYGAASVKSGDRVSVVLKNHSATITGNLSDPPMGRAEVKINDDSIIAKVGEEIQMKMDAMGVRIEATNTRIDGLSETVSLEVNKLGVQINGLTTFSNTTSNKLDSLSNGLSSGTTIIDGGCIKTGTIDAQRISLKGLMSYEYSKDGINDWHYPMATGDMYRRETIDGGKTWGDPYQFVGKDGRNGSDARVPNYIEVRGIDFTDISDNYIRSPKIYSGEFYGNEFNIITDGSHGSLNLYGEFGARQFHFLEISYYEGNGPYVNITSPDKGIIWIGDTNGNINFSGTISFMGAKVEGITATFA